ncbi:hypothetical protein ACLIYM_26855 [Streptomyces fenghuangensis]|uniref:hypothetical protein n=1 Tax=Streptomyces sp. ICN903 TaxID=2964654 RepID=UPI001EDBBD5E|nr:hypothetical protein [Streptomyces sp. ICN903]MCG3043839.1 hypothetical protein [Streptomyces sp. ICN903]
MYHSRDYIRYWDIDFQELPPAAAGAFGVFGLLLMAFLFWGLLKTRHTRPRDPEARERARARAESRRRQAELRKRRLALQRKKAGRR